MEIAAAAGLAPAALHVLNVTGAAILGATESVGAAAAATSAVYAADATRCRIRESQAERVCSSCEFSSPAGVSSLRLTTASEKSTPAVTPRAHSEHDGCSTSGCTTPKSAFLGNLSAGDPSINLGTPSPEIPLIEIGLVVNRLQTGPLTGQVIAWAFKCAAELALVRRAPPVSLLAALWPAALSASGRFTPEDITDMAESWTFLVERWPRHFRFPSSVMGTLTAITFPAAVKRMSDSRLAQLTRSCKIIASYRVDPALCSRGQQGPSARDLMQPIFALVAAEVAWRLCDSVRYVSPETTELVLTVSSSWRWTPVPHRDSRLHAAMKEGTLEALTVLRRKSI